MSFSKRVGDICGKLPDVSGTVVGSVHGSPFDGTSWRINGRTFAKLSRTPRRLSIAVPDKDVAAHIARYQKQDAQTPSVEVLMGALANAGALKMVAKGSGWPTWATLHEYTEDTVLKGWIETSYDIIRQLPPKEKSSGFRVEDLF